MPLGTDETQTTRALEMFFEHKRRHNQDLQGYAAEWDLRYEEAKEKARLSMSNVHGDLNKFHDIRGLAARLSHRIDKAGNTGAVCYEDDKHSSTGHEDWDNESQSYWGETWWSEDRRCGTRTTRGSSTRMSTRPGWVSQRAREATKEKIA
ncbi:unnamed protein product [Symbiodinium sp. CCMP2592]|nr:unnamed protein product [Symbiodinium sp. CCMP2592]